MRITKPVEASVVFEPGDVVVGEYYVWVRGDAANDWTAIGRDNRRVHPSVNSDRHFAIEYRLNTGSVKFPTLKEEN
jgi:hypothetical protein